MVVNKDMEYYFFIATILIISVILITLFYIVFDNIKSFKKDRSLVETSICIISIIGLLFIVSSTVENYNELEILYKYQWKYKLHFID